MEKILYAEPVLQALQRDIYEKPAFPMLAILRSDIDEASMVYAKSATKRITSLGFRTKEIIIPSTSTEEQFIETLRYLSIDNSVDGILVLQPLPPHVDMTEIRKAISPKKDIDCMSLENLGLLAMGEPLFTPCTAEGVMLVLKHYGVPIKGKNVTIINRSLVVGKPLSLLLASEGATVTMCNSLTQELARKAQEADILVVAAGVPNLVTKRFTHENQVVIDVGTTFVNGKIVGDVHTEVYDIAKAYTPVPRGIGSITTTVLGKNLVKASLLH